MSGVGIFGGTFDPIHLGHLRSAWEVTEVLGLDQLYFVPNAQTVHRHQPQTSFSHRCAMVELAIAEVPIWQMSDCEGARGGASYTYDTILHFRQIVGDAPLWLILGSDAYRQLHTWHRWQEIVLLCHIAVMSRAGEAVSGGHELTQQWLQSDDSRRSVGRVISVAVSALAISSSQVRALCLSQQSPRFLLPESVARYIQRNELYIHERCE